MTVAIERRHDLKLARESRHPSKACAETLREHSRGACSDKEPRGSLQTRHGADTQSLAAARSSPATRRQAALSSRMNSCAALRALSWRRCSQTARKRSQTARKQREQTGSVCERTNSHPRPRKHVNKQQTVRKRLRRLPTHAVSVGALHSAQHGRVVRDAACR